MISDINLNIQLTLIVLISTNSYHVMCLPRLRCTPRSAVQLHLANISKDATPTATRMIINIPNAGAMHGGIHAGSRIRGHQLNKLKKLRGRTRQHFFTKKTTDLCIDYCSGD